MIVAMLMFFGAILTTFLIYLIVGLIGSAIYKKEFIAVDGCPMCKGRGFIMAGDLGHDCFEIQCPTCDGTIPPELVNPSDWT